jgi:DNA mismatch repair protein MutS
MSDSSNYLDTEEAGVYDTYIELHNKYNEKYGKACVLFQCGSFFEIYGKEDENKKLGDIYTISEAAGNLAVASKTNGWLMAGFNPAYIDKYAPLLVENGYTVVVVEQVTPPPKPKRSITRIISPSTYLDDINLGNSNKVKNKVLMSVYVEFTKTSEILAISMAAMDLSLGKSTLYTVCNSSSAYANNTTKTLKDKERCVDECFRFIHSMAPIEIMFYTEREEQLNLLKSLISSFGIESIVNSIHTNIVPKEYVRSQYIQEFLKRFYADTGLLSPLEYLGLTRLQSLATTFIILVNFAYEHDESITKQLHKPMFWENTKYLTIENNGIYQLNVVKTHNINRSLIDVLDYTSTSIGRRLHKDRLLNPVVNSDIINRRYSQIEWMMEGEKYKRFEETLKKVLDIERLHRKIENGTINPQHFILLERSYEEILKVMDLFNSYSNSYCSSTNNTTTNIFNFWNVKMYENFLDWREDYRSIFDLKECQKYHLNNIRSSFFNHGVDPTIDSLQNQLDTKTKEIYTISSVLSNSIKDHVTVFAKGKKKAAQAAKDDEEETSDYIKVDRNDRDGFYYSTTKKRAELVKKYGEPQIKKFGWGELRYSSQTSTVKITSDNLSQINKTIDIIEEQLQSKCRELFLTKVQELYQTHKGIFDEIVQFISEIDWICSSAKCAKVNFYCKPQILENTKDTSYIKAKAMRHPIIEKILSDTHYVPNDVEIGTASQKGMLLFGTNSSGKSSLMKSVGLNVIMAQSGMYVPCEEFTYSPYKNILTRITGDDNFSKGFSSFVVEMTELRTILNRSGSNSLVLGDEICHGTEQVSALAIVSSSIVELSKKNCNFIFATHLHRLSNMEEINELHNVQCWHLKVLYDEANDCLIYDRKLEKGAGSDLYGLEVAKYIIGDQPEFIKRCMAIRRKILDIPAELVSTRTSKYNAKLVVDKCKICGSRADDTHHIDFQCSADSDGAIQRGEKRFHKNVEANLVTLCKSCHIKVHHSVDGKKYNIDGYFQTSKGTVLKWKEVEC